MKCTCHDNLESVTTSHDQFPDPVLPSTPINSPGRGSSLWVRAQGHSCYALSRGYARFIEHLSAHRAISHRTKPPFLSSVSLVQMSNGKYDDDDTPFEWSGKDSSRGAQSRPRATGTNVRTAREPPRRCGYTQRERELKASISPGGRDGP